MISSPRRMPTFVRRLRAPDAPARRTLPLSADRERGGGESEERMLQKWIVV